MEVDLSLSDLFKKTFGYQMPEWTPKFETVFGDVVEYSKKNYLALNMKQKLQKVLTMPINQFSYYWITLF